MSDEHDASNGEELAELRAIARRVEMTGSVMEEPPAGLWERIASEAGVATAAGDARSDDSMRVVGPSSTGDAPVPIRRGARRPARRPALPWILGAAAAVVIALVGLVAVLDRSDGQTVLATTQLDRLGPTGSGAAELVDHDGALSLRIDTSELDPSDGFLEVWVIDPEVSKLVSLGPLRQDGIYDIPAGLDPRQFPIVDVSVEPLDGDPTHSGNSVLRGQLSF